MALNKEAELAYGTTLGKLRIAWNQLKDSLIDIGGTCGRSGVSSGRSSGPVIEKS